MHPSYLFLRPSSLRREEEEEEEGPPLSSTNVAAIDADDKTSSNDFLAINSLLSKGLLNIAGRMRLESKPLSPDLSIISLDDLRTVAT